MKTVFKVRYGYGSTDYLLVDNLNDLSKAIYAKVEKVPTTIGGKFISGQEIKDIVTDIHSYTGWYRTYEPTDPDDFKQIERDVPPELFHLLEGVAKRVNHHIATGSVHLIGSERLTPALLLETKQPDLKELPASVYRIEPKKLNNASSGA